MRVIKAFSKFKNLHRKSAHKNRKWITEGHKVYPNNTKTYGPSTTKGITKVQVTPFPKNASFVWMQPDWKRSQKTKQKENKNV